MALIFCKECGKEISDTATSCPHCGFVLKKDCEPIRVTELSQVETNQSAGILNIAVGIVAIIFGLFTVAIFIGIFAIIGGAAFISIGVKKIKGTQKGLCPYCEHDVEVPASATTYKCQHCKKVSTKKGNSLETII